jgi:hypothetical protein
MTNTSPANAALRELAVELGSAAPREFERLDEAELKRLVGLLRDAREQQTAALLKAIDDGLSFIPRLARGAVRRALFG